MQRMRTRVGALALGTSVTVSGSSFVAHHGHCVSGSGDGALSLSRCCFHVVIFADTSASVLAVAVRPTQSPTEKRTSPSVAGSSRRIVSSAQIIVAARCSWSSVSSRRVYRSSTATP